MQHQPQAHEISYQMASDTGPAPPTTPPKAPRHRPRPGPAPPTTSTTPMGRTGRTPRDHAETPAPTRSRRGCLGRIRSNPLTPTVKTRLDDRRAPRAPRGSARFRVTRCRSEADRDLLAGGQPLNAESVGGGVNRAHVDERVEAAVVRGLDHEDSAMRPAWRRDR